MSIVSLDAQKKSIISGIKTAATIAANASVDSTSLSISIWGSGIRGELGAKSNSCDEISRSIAIQAYLKTANANDSASTVNSKLNELNSLVSWAGSAFPQVEATQGITGSATSALQEAWKSTMDFASTVIKQSVANANTALTALAANQESNNDGSKDDSKDGDKKDSKGSGNDPAKTDFSQSFDTADEALTSARQGENASTTTTPAGSAIVTGADTSTPDTK